VGAQTTGDPDPVADFCGVGGSSSMNSRHSCCDVMVNVGLTVVGSLQLRCPERKRILSEDGYGTTDLTGRTLDPVSHSRSKADQSTDSGHRRHPPCDRLLEILSNGGGRLRVRKAARASRHGAAGFIRIAVADHQQHVGPLPWHPRDDRNASARERHGGVKGVAA